MSRISELINCVKIYNLCNHCDHFKYGECSVDNVNCKEEIEKQIISEIRADAIDECVQIIQKIKDDYNDSKFEKQTSINYGTICGIIISLEQLKEQK